MNKPESYRNNETYMSAETYRAVIPSIAPSSLQTKEILSEKIALQKKEINHEEIVPPSLPCSLENYRCEPHHAVLKGPFASVFDTVLKAIEANHVHVRKSNKAKGKIKCYFDASDEKFKMLVQNTFSTCKTNVLY